MSDLTLEDIAVLLDGEDGAELTLPAETAQRWRKRVRTAPELQEEIARLVELADAAGLAPEDAERLKGGLEIRRQLDELLSATWDEPAEILDPDGSIGVEVAALHHLAETLAKSEEPPGDLAEARRKLERVLDEHRRDQELVSKLVEELARRDARKARRMLRQIDRELSETLRTVFDDEGYRES